jgi:hypothetical protein
MSKVVFKLRVIAPHSEGAAARNKAHIRYIGQRPGVALTEGMSHGLFGSVMGKRAEEIKKISEIQNYVERKTAEGAVTFRAIISMTEADAMAKGYGARKTWEQLIRRKLPEIAEAVGIPPSRLEYAVAVHFEKGHPHCHVMFWDREQGVLDAFARPETADDIRIDLIKYVFGEDMSFWHAIKNEARAATVELTRGGMGEFVEGFSAGIADMTTREYAAAMKRVKLESDLSDFRMDYSHYGGDTVFTLAAELLRLRDKLPKTGRFAMKFMKPGQKAEIRAFVWDLINKDDGCRREYGKYIAAAVELAKFYSDDPEAHDAAKDAAHDDIMNRVGNAVLKAIKKLNEADFTFRDEVRREAVRREMIESLITEVFGILARSASAEENKAQYARRYGELSKQARKELAIKHEDDTGYAWER